VKIQEQKDFDSLQTKIEFLPPTVKDYVHYKLSENLSPSSLLEYSRDFEFFFSWMILEIMPDIKRILEITINHLEQLNLKSIVDYETYLRVVEGNKERTIARKLQSLRSFFNYLHDVAVNTEGEPLLRKNVFRKITSKRLTDSLSTARAIQKKVLVSEESDDFINYIRTGYRVENSSNLQALWFYDLNVLRDICIISLMLKTGLLVSDIVNMNLSDVSLQHKQITIIRQGAGLRSTHIVLFGNSICEDLVNYLNVREKKYRPEINEKAFFLAIPNGRTIGNRITKRAIQVLVNKYSAKYGKPEVTTRQLRYSFGLDYQNKSDFVQTKQQLALRNIEHTEKYEILSKMLGLET